MTESIINHVMAKPPATGNRISFVRLGARESLDLRELYESAGRVAAGLRRMGVRPGDRIGILASNRLEWVLLDLAALRLKAVTAGLEPGKFSADARLVARYDLRLLFTDQEAAGEGVHPVELVRQLADGPDVALPPVTYAPQEVTTLKFTSGSTGEPKGLAATVGSIDSSLRAVQQMFEHGSGDDLFVFLPLSLLQQRYWIYSALRYGHDVTVSTYESAFAALSTVGPTVVMGVPGFFETARAHIEARAARAADGLREDVRRDAAVRLFGPRIRYLWTGSAPASIDTLRFFTDVGLPIYEGYGLNETCIVAKNHPGAHRAGSVGKVLPGKEVLFDSDGVISVRSEHPVNERYEYCAPGDSERVFVAPRTVRTGDVGYLDQDGFLHISGRADDVIVLDNGRKVVVRPIEEHMGRSPAVAHCVLFCPKQTYLVAVVSPATEPADRAEIEAQLARTNAAFGHDEQIRKVVVAEPFTIENDLLTSQYKPRRRLIFDRYRNEITDPRGGLS